MEEEIEYRTKYILGLRRTAVVETLTFLIGLTLLNFFFGSGERFIGVNPHPFWIIILLVTVQYGTREGIFAAIASIVFLYAGNIPPMAFNETLFDYRLRLFLQPTLWIVTATVLGEMRLRVEFDRQRYRDAAKKARSEAETIASAYEQLKERKEQVEVRLASQIDTLATAYSSLRSLESLNPAQIFVSLKDFVHQSVKPEKFSLYAFSEGGFESVIHEGWDPKDHYQRRFAIDHPLTKTLLSRKRMVCVINADDEKVLEGEGILAAPILDKETGEIFGMLKIERMPFSEMHLSNLETCETLCEVIGTTFANARKFKALERTSMYEDYEEGIYSKALYQLLNTLFKRERMDGFSIALVRTREKGLSNDEVQTARKNAFLVARSLSPKEAWVFSESKQDLALRIVVPGLEENATRSLALKIASRIEEVSSMTLDVQVLPLGGSEEKDLLRKERPN